MTAAKRKPVLWSCGVDEEYLHAIEPDEAIECYLDERDPKDWPETLTVYGFAPMELAENEPDGERLLYGLLEELDQTYGDPGGDPNEATPAMLTAAREFAAVIRREYAPCACTHTGEEVTVNVREWVAANCPEWLDEEATL